MMPELHVPWLELSILLPLLAAIWIGSLRDREFARRLCVVVCGFTFLFAAAESVDSGTLHAFEAHDHWDVIEWMFHKDVFVVDELSGPLLPLAALLYLMTVLSTLRTKVSRFSFGWTLTSEAVLLATLSCREPWVLIALLSIATIPPWLELRSRGRSTRVYALHMGLLIALLVAGQSLLDASSPGSRMTIVAGALLDDGSV
jgi:NADH-quinone oxidoreductase subunit M